MVHQTLCPQSPMISYDEQSTCGVLRARDTLKSTWHPHIWKQVSVGVNLHCSHKSLAIEEGPEPRESQLPYVIMVGTKQKVQVFV